jgi:MFS family permease
MQTPWIYRLYAALGLPPRLFLPVLILSTLVNFVIALWFGGLMARKGRSRILGIALVVCLGALGMIIAALIPGLETSHRLRRRGPPDYSAGIGKGFQRQQDGTLAEAEATRLCPHCASRVPADSAICRVCHQPLLVVGG